MTTPTLPVPRIRRTHLSLFVRDPEISARFYEDVLGMKIAARDPRWIFMSFGQKHHDIALVRADQESERGAIGLQHYGLEIDGDLDELRRLYGMLLHRGIEIVKVTDHKVGIGVYFNDPDGNRLEFFCETAGDDAEGRRLFYEHHAPSDPTQLEPIMPAAATTSDPQ